MRVSDPEAVVVSVAKKLSTKEKEIARACSVQVAGNSSVSNPGRDLIKQFVQKFIRENVIANRG